MAHKILGNYGAAREGAYFKVEQEADLQKHRERLVREGVLKKSIVRPDPKSMEESVHAFEIQPEILQQQARVDDPDAAKRRQFLRRGKAVLPNLTPEERYRYRLSGSVMGNTIGHIPRVSMGRDRWNVQLPPSAAPPMLRTLSPEAAEVARRTYVAGLRALIYGTLLGVGAIALAGSYITQSLEIGQPGVDAAGAVRQRLQPFADWVRNLAAPAKDAVGGLAGAGNPPGERSEFQQRLVKRYNPGAATTASESGPVVHGVRE